MRKTIACLLAVLSAFIVYGRNPSDSVKVYFSLNQWQFDQEYRGNAAAMEDFIGKVREAVQADNLDHITVSGYASPDGPASLNERLSGKRCEVIAEYIIEQAGIAPEMILTCPKGIAWEQLRHMVDENRNVPQRRQVLEILDNGIPESSDYDGIRELNRQLRSLGEGLTYRWMINHIFPELRHTLAVAIYLKSGDGQDGDGNYGGTDSSIQNTYPDVTQVAENTEATDNGPKDARNDTAADTAAYDTVQLNETDRIPDTGTTPDYRLAVKTNMLYYAALMPNVELEYLINRNWSASAQWNIAWYGNDAKCKAYEISEIDAEVRYWIRPREPWRGLFVGLHAGGGWYDLENGGTGYMGEALITGASLGYSWPVGKRLLISTEFGIGYVHTRYREYIPLDGHFVYQRTKSIDYFGPVMLKVSIGCRFWDRNKSKWHKSDHEE